MVLSETRQFLSTEESDDSFLHFWIFLLHWVGNNMSTSITLEQHNTTHKWTNNIFFVTKQCDLFKEDFVVKDHLQKI